MIEEEGEREKGKKLKKLLSRSRAKAGTTRMKVGLFGLRLEMDL